MLPQHDMPHTPHRRLCASMLDCSAPPNHSDTGSSTGYYLRSDTATPQPKMIPHDMPSAGQLPNLPIMWSFDSAVGKKTRRGALSWQQVSSATGLHRGSATSTVRLTTMLTSLSFSHAAFFTIPSIPTITITTHVSPRHRHTHPTSPVVCPIRGTVHLAPIARPPHPLSARKCLSC